MEGSRITQREPPLERPPSTSAQPWRRDRTTPKDPHPHAATDGSTTRANSNTKPHTWIVNKRKYSCDFWSQSLLKSSSQITWCPFSVLCQQVWCHHQNKLVKSTYADFVSISVANDWWGVPSNSHFSTKQKTSFRSKQVKEPGSHDRVLDVWNVYVWNIFSFRSNIRRCGSMVLFFFVRILWGNIVGTTTGNCR